MALKRADVNAQPSAYDADSVAEKGVEDAGQATSQNQAADVVSETSSSHAEVDHSASAEGELVSGEAGKASDATAQVQEEAKPEAKPEAKSGAIATRSETSAIASQGINQRLNTLAQDGMEGLEMGFGAFPTFILRSEGHIETSDGIMVGSHFDALVQSSRPKFIIKNTKCEKRDEDFVYTYDATWLNNADSMDTNGRSIHAQIAAWKEKGWGYEAKKYLDVGVEVVGGDFDGQFVIVQVPPTSIARFSGYAFARNVKQVKTRFAVGQKVTNVDYPFYPWAFSLSPAI